MTNIRELFAENLKKYRHAIGLSQSKLAEKVNTSTHYLGMLELQRKFPSPEMMERLASALGIDTTELFLKETMPDNVIKAYRISAVEDIQWAVEKLFKERLRELGAEPVEKKV
jgi:transcriptional regulator with XRE-family HTH domain